MGPQDGVDYALRALAHLRHDLGRDDFHAAFIGSGDVFDEMVALAAELGLDDEVEFTGRISDEDAHALPLDRRRLPRARPEEPAERRLDDEQDRRVHGDGPRRSSRSTWSRARVSAGEAAVYATPNDEREFAGLVGELLDDPERRARMGALGQRRAGRGAFLGAQRRQPRRRVRTAARGRQESPVAAAQWTPARDLRRLGGAHDQGDDHRPRLRRAVARLRPLARLAAGARRPHRRRRLGAAHLGDPADHRAGVVLHDVQPHAGRPRRLRIPQPLRPLLRRALHRRRVGHQGAAPLGLRDAAGEVVDRALGCPAPIPRAR